MVEGQRAPRKHIPRPVGCFLGEMRSAVNKVIIDDFIKVFVFTLTT